MSDDSPKNLCRFFVFFGVGAAFFTIFIVATGAPNGIIIGLIVMIVTMSVLCLIVTVCSSNSPTASNHNQIGDGKYWYQHRRSSDITAGIGLSESISHIYTIPDNNWHYNISDGGGGDSGNGGGGSYDSGGGCDS